MDLPVHIGIIMDGNRRWAKEHNLSANKGHEAGAETLRQIVLQAIKKNIRYLSVYAFSTENWQRTQDEVGYLMRLVIEALKRHLNELDEAGVKITILGGEDGVDVKVLKTIRTAEAQTKNNQKMTLAVCFNYGGQKEITDAVRKIVAAKVQSQDITEQTIAANLYHPEIPPIDIIIRTSGEMRTSNFMLWRSAYSELMFIDKHWPDFNEADLDNVIAEYAKRQRRYGA